MVRVWDLDTFRKVSDFEGPRVRPYALRLDRSAEGALFLSAAHTWRWLWSIDHNELVRIGGNRRDLHSKDSLSREEWWDFLDHIFGPKGEPYLVKYITDPARLEIALAANGARKGWIPLEKLSLKLIALGGVNNSQLLAAVADVERGSVAIWDLNTRKVLTYRSQLRLDIRLPRYQQPIHTSTPFGFLNMPNGRTVAVALTLDSRIMSWDAISGDNVGLFNTFGTSIQDFEISSAGEHGRPLLLVPDQEASTTYVYVAREQELKQLDGSTQPRITAIATGTSFDDRDLIAVGHADGTVSVRKLANMEPIYTIAAPDLCLSLAIGVFDGRTMLICVSANHDLILLSELTANSSRTFLDPRPLRSGPSMRAPGPVKSIIVTHRGAPNGFFATVHSQGDVTSWSSTGGWRKRWSTVDDSLTNSSDEHFAEAGIFFVPPRGDDVYLVTAGFAKSALITVRDALSGRVIDQVHRKDIAAVLGRSNESDRRGHYQSIHVVSICSFDGLDGEPRISICCSDGSTLVFHTTRWSLDFDNSLWRPTDLSDQTSAIASNTRSGALGMITATAMRDHSIQVNRWVNAESFFIRRRFVPAMICLTGSHLVVLDMDGLTKIDLRIEVDRSRRMKNLRL